MTPRPAPAIGEDLARHYEALRAVAHGAPHATPATVGLGVFHVRGMTGWAAALPTLLAAAKATPPPPPNKEAGGTHPELVHILTGMTLACMGGGT